MYMKMNVTKKGQREGSASKWGREAVQKVKLN